MIGGSDSWLHLIINYPLILNGRPVSMRPQYFWVFLWEFWTPLFKESVMIFFYFECAFKKTYLTQIWTEQKNKIESIKKNNKLIGSSSPSDESLPNSLCTLLTYNITIRIWWWILFHILFHSILTSKLGRKIEQSICYHPCSMGKETERKQLPCLRYTVIDRSKIRGSGYRLPAHCFSLHQREEYVLPHILDL